MITFSLSQQSPSLLSPSLIITHLPFPIITISHYNYHHLHSYYFLITISLLFSTGPSSPNKPINVTAVNILYNGATITWIVSSIAYTPEQYTIQYGLQSNDLSNNSTIVSGSTDFSSTNDMFSISLTNLIHDTTYYYQVTATNTEGSINSDTKSFKTREKRKIRVNINVCIY